MFWNLVRVNRALKNIEITQNRKQINQNRALTGSETMLIEQRVTGEISRPLSKTTQNPTPSKTTKSTTDFYRVPGGISWFSTRIGPECWVNRFQNIIFLLPLFVSHTGLSHFLLLQWWDYGWRIFEKCKFNSSKFTPLYLFFSMVHFSTSGTSIILLHFNLLFIC